MCVFAHPEGLHADLRIEGNHIHHVCTETDDCGAIYTGRDYTARGNVVRHNLIADVIGNKHLAIGIYMDDCVSGQTIEGNIIVHARMAMLLGGGRDLVVRSNLLLDCDQGIRIDGRGLSDAPVWRNMVYRIMKERLDAMRPHEPPYSEAYPELAELDAFYAADDGIPPKVVLERNIAGYGALCRIHWGANDAHVTQVDNLWGGDPGVEAGSFRLRKAGPGRALGFAEIPLGRIGPGRSALGPE